MTLTSSVAEVVESQPTPPAASGNLSYTVKADDALGNSSAASTPRTVLYDITPPAAITTYCRPLFPR